MMCGITCGRYRWKPEPCSWQRTLIVMMTSSLTEERVP
jgi:hypothetical protein